MTCFTVFVIIARLKKLPIKSGFIHVPYLPEQILDKPTTSSMSLVDMLRGIEVALQVIADDCK